MITASNNKTNQLEKSPSSRPPKKDGLKEGIRRIRILVVDDDPLVLMASNAVLEDCGYSTKTTENPHEAIRLFKEGGFDLVISDVIMPKMNGYELLKQLKAIDENALVIMTSGYSEIPLSDMESAGAKAFLRKPYRMDELKGIIERVLGNGNGNRMIVK